MNENVVSTAQLMSHNFTVETLREGVYYNVNVRAVNRVGPSETFQTGFTVNINMPSKKDMLSGRATGGHNQLSRVQFPAIASFVFFPLYDVSLIITCGLIITSIFHAIF